MKLAIMCSFSPQPSSQDSPRNYTDPELDLTWSLRDYLRSPTISSAWMDPDPDIGWWPVHFDRLKPCQSSQEQG